MSNGVKGKLHAFHFIDVWLNLKQLAGLTALLRVSLGSITWISDGVQVIMAHIDLNFHGDSDSLCTYILST